MFRAFVSAMMLGHCPSQVHCRQDCKNKCLQQCYEQFQEVHEYRKQNTHGANPDAFKNKNYAEKAQDYYVTCCDIGEKTNCQRKGFCEYSDHFN